MERRRLKTILILILALLNGFLVFHLAHRHAAETAAARLAETRLAELFAADGVTLGPGVFSRETPPDAVLLLRDEAREDTVAAFFLGRGGERLRQGSTRWIQTGNASAWFRADGTFSVTGLDVREGTEDLCRRFCRTWSYEAPDFNGGEDVSVRAKYGEYLVYDCSVTFRFEEGVLREVFGTLLPGTGVPVTRETPFLGAAGALAAFQTIRQETRAVASAVTGVSLCYSLRTDGELSLIPAWRIATDTVDYFVRCDDGAVSAG